MFHDVEKSDVVAVISSNVWFEKVEWDKQIWNSLQNLYNVKKIFGDPANEFEKDTIEFFQTLYMLSMKSLSAAHGKLLNHLKASALITAQGVFDIFGYSFQ